jgi:hypothetical protein
MTYTQTHTAEGAAGVANPAGKLLAEAFDLLRQRAESPCGPFTAECVKRHERQARQAS